MKSQLDKQKEIRRYYSDWYWFTGLILLLPLLINGSQIILGAVGLLSLAISLYLTFSKPTKQKREKGK